MVFSPKSAILAFGVELQASVQVPVTWHEPVPVMGILVQLPAAKAGTGKCLG